MNRFLLITFVFITYSTGISAQLNSFVTGTVKDTGNMQQLNGATISLINSRDSSLLSFVRTDSSGNFGFKNVPKGKYRLSATHSGFHTAWLTFNVPGDSAVNLGQIYLRDKSLLDEIVVEAEKAPVTVNGDTLEFNASSFATKPNAVVEDLLKKMPGIQVDKDGTIRVNGQRINKVFVNGREFFTGDPKLATQNLPADAVDKVQVFEKKSDQSESTGFNDGNGETALNLKLKKDKKNPTFGKIKAGAGIPGRYDGQFNVNRFKGDQQFSAIGMANNTNRQGFSIMDILNFTGETRNMMKGGNGGGMRIEINDGGSIDFGLPVDGGGASASGIAKTIAGGLNFNDTWNKKTDVNGSYFYNNLKVATDQHLKRKFISSLNPYGYSENSNNNKATESSRFNISIDHKIDSFNSIKFTPSYTHQVNQYNSSNDYVSAFADNTKLNDGFSNTMSGATGDDFKNSILFRHRFAKKGRTISASFSLAWNNSRSQGSQHSINDFFARDSTQSTDTINQVNHVKSIIQNYGGNITYTEPLSKKTLIELNVSYNFNKGNLNRLTYDYNNYNNKYDKFNPLQSSVFNNEYQYAGGGAGLKNIHKKYSVSIAANLQYATLTSRLKDSAFMVFQSFINVLPSANFAWNFTRSKTFRLDYNTRNRQPTSSQLQPVTDISDPLNIRVGNPSLKQEYTHNATAQYFSANPLMQKNLMLMINASATQNAIVNADDINAQGIRATHPVNADGVYNVFAIVDWGFRVKEINTGFTLGGNVFLNKNVNLVNGLRNNIHLVSYTPRSSVNYNYKDKLDIAAEARVSYNTVRYSLQPSLNNNYLQQEYSMEANAALSFGIGINSDITYTANTGRSAGFNSYFTKWNAAITKQMLKNKKGELKFSVSDILNQNTGISRNANQNYIEDVTYKTLKRYYIIGFTYSLLKTNNNGPKAVIRTF
jgi:Outer membrane protein beta-barrel family/Carboxypeptidase regulatory-like domain